jgi:hypothetical protein
MLVAIATVHVHNGFFMNWYGQQKGEGFEYHLLAIAMGLVILIKGAGALSVDHALSGGGRIVKASAAAEASGSSKEGATSLRLRLCGVSFAAFALGSVALGVLAAETLDAAGGVNQLLLAGEERMTGGANFHVDVALVGGTGEKRIAAGAMDAHFLVSGMDGCFHKTPKQLTRMLILPDTAASRQPGVACGTRC